MRNDVTGSFQVFGELKVQFVYDEGVQWLPAVYYYTIDISFMC